MIQKASGKVAAHNSPETGEIDVILEVLISESDRGCILVAAQLIDSALEDLLFTAFDRSPKVRKQAVKRLLTFDGPFAAFGSRIQLAYALGFLTDSAFEDLELIRKIRNAAAHSLTTTAFINPAIGSKVAKFSNGMNLFNEGLAHRTASNPEEIDLDDGKKYHRNRVIFCLVTAWHWRGLCAQRIRVKHDGPLGWPELVELHLTKQSLVDAGAERASPSS